MSEHRAVVKYLRCAGYRFFQDEAELQAAVANTLQSLGVPFEREYRIDARSRIDFLVHRGIGVEVKVDGTLAALTRQLHRYAQHESIGSLVVVTNRSRLTGLPRELSGKPVEVVYTVGAAL